MRVQRSPALRDTSTNSSSSDAAATQQRTFPMKRLLRVSPTVAAALRSPTTAVVALESTVVTHGGLGYPRNVEVARELERSVREAGATPATIAVMDGRVVVGVSDDELERLADAATRNEAKKCSTRDLPFALATIAFGSTTVAATMKAAHLAGIEFFATGGLGGVHRGAFAGPNPSLDVSADLTELAKTPVAVVCAGVKSILDVGLTLEFLETQGVPVVVFGDSPRFPRFFTSGSDDALAPSFTADLDELARVWLASRGLGLPSGAIVAVPPPRPLPHVEAAISQALVDLNRNSATVKGKDVTPFLLKRVAEITKGDSVLSNIELLKNNARVAGRLAMAAKRVSSSLRTLPPPNKGDERTKKGVCVVGGSAVDVEARPFRDDASSPTSSRPGIVHVRAGGVARNVATCVGLLASASHTPPPVMLSPIANDDFGNVVRSSLDKAGVLTNGLLTSSQPSARTPCVVRVLDAQGQLVRSVADFELELSGADVATPASQAILKEAAVVVVDGNAAALLPAVLAASPQSLVIFEPTSVAKAVGVVPHLSRVTMVTPNADELVALAKEVRRIRGTERAPVPQNLTSIVEAELSRAGGGGGGMTLDRASRAAADVADVAGEMARGLLNPQRTHALILASFGPDGALLVRFTREGGVEAAHERDAEPPLIRSVSGAGDTQAGLLAWTLAQTSPANLDVRATLRAARAAARLTLRSGEPVAPDVGDVVVGAAPGPWFPSPPKL